MNYWTMVSISLISSVISLTIKEVNCETRIFQGKLFRDQKDKNELFPSRKIPPEKLSSAKSGVVLQPLDHFNPQNEHFFEQKYFYNNDFYNGKRTKLVCLMVGGEGPLNSIWILKGAMIKYAEQINCLPLTIEHRFFGSSHSNHFDASTDNLRFLTISQALEDFARATLIIKDKLEIPNAKVILFGGSYPGSLVSYLRFKFPHIFHSGVASSAPLDWKPVYAGYYKIVGRVIKEISPTCYSTIENAFKILEHPIDLNCTTNCSTIDEKFKICQSTDQITYAQYNLTNRDDLIGFLSTIIGNFGYVTQYNGLMGNMSLNYLCNLANSTNGTDLDKLASMSNEMLRFLQIPCIEISFNDYCAYFQQTSWNSNPVSSGARTWMWLVCTQLGSIQTADGPGQPFGTLQTAKWMRKICYCVFGPEFNSSKTWIDERLTDTRITYGGKDIKESKIVFLNGRNDPWSGLGFIFQNETTCDNKVIYIEGASHCNDMEPGTLKDSLALKAAREIILVDIVKDIGMCEYYEANGKNYC